MSSRRHLTGSRPLRTAGSPAGFSGYRVGPPSWVSAMTPTVDLRQQDLGICKDPHPPNTVKLTLTGAYASRVPARDLCEAAIKLTGGALTSASLHQISYYRLARPAEVFLTLPLTYPAQGLYGQSHSFGHQSRGIFSNPRTTSRRVFLSWVPPTYTREQVALVAASFLPPGFQLESHYGGRRDRHLLLTDAKEEDIPHYVRILMEEGDPFFIMVTYQGRMPVCALCQSPRHLHPACKVEASRLTQPTVVTMGIRASPSEDQDEPEVRALSAPDTSPQDHLEVRAPLGQDKPPQDEPEVRAFPAPDVLVDDTAEMGGHSAPPPNDATNAASESPRRPPARKSLFTNDATAEVGGHSVPSPNDATNATGSPPKELGLCADLVNTETTSGGQEEPPTQLHHQQGPPAPAPNVNTDAPVTDATDSKEEGNLIIAEEEIPSPPLQQQKPSTPLWSDATGGGSGGEAPLPSQHQFSDNAPLGYATDSTQRKRTNHELTPPAEQTPASRPRNALTDPSSLTDSPTHQPTSEREVHTSPVKPRLKVRDTPPVKSQRTDQLNSSPVDLDSPVWKRRPPPPPPPEEAPLATHSESRLNKRNLRAIQCYTDRTSNTPFLDVFNTLLQSYNPNHRMPWYYLRAILTDNGYTDSIHIRTETD